MEGFGRKEELGQQLEQWGGREAWFESLYTVFIVAWRCTWVCSFIASWAISFAFSISDCCTFASSVILICAWRNINS